MSLNSYPPRKANPELSRLIDEFFRDGGQITMKRDAGNTTIICSICHHRRHVAIEYARSNLGSR